MRVSICVRAVPPEIELEGRVGEPLEVPQSFDLLPGLDDALQQRAVLLLLAVPQTPGAPVAEKSQLPGSSRPASPFPPGKPRPNQGLTPPQSPQERRPSEGEL